MTRKTERKMARLLLAVLYPLLRIVCARGPRQDLPKHPEANEPVPSCLTVEMRSECKLQGVIARMTGKKVTANPHSGPKANAWAIGWATPRRTPPVPTCLAHGDLGEVAAMFLLIEDSPYRLDRTRDALEVLTPRQADYLLELTGITRAALEENQGLDFETPADTSHSIGAIDDALTDSIYEAVA